MRPVVFRMQMLDMNAAVAHHQPECRYIDMIPAPPCVVIPRIRNASISIVDHPYQHLHPHIVIAVAASSPPPSSSSSSSSRNCNPPPYNHNMIIITPSTHLSTGWNEAVAINQAYYSIPQLVWAGYFGRPNWPNSQWNIKSAELLYSSSPLYHDKQR